MLRRNSRKRLLRQVFNEHDSVSSGHAYKSIALIALPFVLLVVLYRIEDWLLKSGFLNKNDIGFVSDESGTFYEYVTNIWYWDAALFFLTVLAVIFSVVMLTKFLKERKSDGSIK